MLSTRVRMSAGKKKQPLYLYREGDTCDALTGGYTTQTSFSGYGSGGQVYVRSDHVEVYANGTYAIAQYRTNNSINYTGYTHGLVDMEIVSISSPSSSNTSLDRYIRFLDPESNLFHIYISSDWGNFYTPSEAENWGIGRYTYEVPLAVLNNSGKLAFHVAHAQRSGATSIKIYSVALV